jgi:hypothetical protein
MKIPERSRPYWPDALETFKDPVSGLKDWNWALERLEQSHNYWIATGSPDGRPHLMVVWGIWWRDAFWFSTGRSTRKAKNLAANSRCVIGTEKADEAVVVEGFAAEISDRAVWKELIPVYNRKYGGDIAPLLEKSNSTIFRVEPQVVFAQDENAANFAESVTRWRFK